MKCIPVRSGIFIVVLPLFFACNEHDDTPVDLEADPIIESVTLQTRWNTRSSTPYRIEVKTRDPQGPSNLDIVYLRITEQDKDAVIFSDSLYDDGAFYHPDDGDVLAGDGVFSNRFLPSLISTSAEELTYVFDFVALDQDGHESKSVERIVIFAPNYSPYIFQVTAPDTFPWINNEVVFSISVADSDGIDDIINVYFESQEVATGAKKFESNLYNDGDITAHGDTVAGDSIYSAKLDSSFRVNKQGQYDLFFHVEDSYGEEYTFTPAHRIFVGNAGAQFVSIHVPTVMTKPPTPGDYNRELMTVEVSDPQGLADIDSVYFYSLKPDSTLANMGKPFLLVDDGVPFNPSTRDPETGDLAAGDGIYSYSIIVYNNPQTNLGVYTFYIYIRDKAGNLTGPETRQIAIIED
jgi:hypothetical protein